MNTDTPLLRTIEQLGAPILRRIAAPVERCDDPKVSQVIAAMRATLAATQGVGLAAPQIGEALRIIIVASRPTVRYPHAPLMAPIVMLNPAFTVLSEEQDQDWEGCLSIPGLRALVPRYRNIAVSYADPTGQCHDMTLQGFVARIFQHEYDHLDGLVYLDRVESNRDIITEQEFYKRIAAKT